MNTNKQIFRQGDVLVVPVASIPQGLKQTKRVTLAFGEVTGHHHSIFSGAVGFADQEDALSSFISVNDTAGADLVHQEHDTIRIPAGDYKIVRQVEYTPEAIRNVAD